MCKIVFFIVNEQSKIFVKRYSNEKQKSLTISYIHSLVKFYIVTNSFKYWAILQVKGV